MQAHLPHDRSVSKRDALSKRRTTCVDEACSSLCRYAGFLCSTGGNHAPG